MANPSTCAHPVVRRAAGAWVCAQCGAEVSGAPAASVAPLPLLPEELLRGLLVAACTLPIALLLHQLFLSRWIIIVFGTLVHECGHALVAWLTGHPALPSFDLVYGGGVTSVGAFQSWLFVVVWGAIIALAWTVRARLDWCVPLLVLAGCQLLLVITGAAEPTQIAAGPVAPILFAGLLLARVLTNEAILTPAERWVSGVVGWMLLGETIQRWWAVTHDPDALDQYLAGKGGIDNDLVRLADDYGISTLSHLATALIVLAVLTPLLVGLIQWIRARAGWLIAT